MSKVIADYRCKICEKNYSSYQSLWIHNKKFHPLNSTILPRIPQFYHRIPQFYHFELFNVIIVKNIFKN